MGPYVFISWSLRLPWKVLRGKKNSAPRTASHQHSLIGELFRKIFGGFSADFSVAGANAHYYFSIYRLGNPVEILTPQAWSVLTSVVIARLRILRHWIAHHRHHKSNCVVYPGSVFLFYFLQWIWFTGIAHDNSALLINNWYPISLWSASKGLIDSRDVIIFWVLTGLMLLCSKIIIGSRQW